MKELGFYLKFRCVNCGNKYGEHPERCGLCGCNKFEKITPEFESLEHNYYQSEQSKHKNQRS